MSNVGTAGWLLAAVAITGIFITTLLAMYFVFPGFFYRHLLELPSHDFMIFCLLDFPSFAIAFFVMALVWVQIKVTGWLILFVLLYVISVVYKLYFFPKKKEGDAAGEKNERTDAKQGKLKLIGAVLLIDSFKVLSLWSVLLIPLLFTFFLAERYEQSFHDESAAWTILAGMYFFILMVNHWVARADRWWFPLAIGPVVLFTLLGVSQQFSWIPKVVVGIFSIGNIQNATLLLDEQGCHVVENFAHSAAVNAPKILANVKLATCQLPAANILWRIGSEYFVELDVTSTRQHSLQKIKFTIPSAHVLSWSVAEQRKASSE